MHIKTSITVIALFATILFTGCEDDSGTGKSDAYLAGTWRYQTGWSNGTATTRLESGEDGQIKNDTAHTSGDLRLKLYFTTSKYRDGDQIQGYVMVDRSVGTLESRHYKHNISFTDSKGIPPVGAYYVTLVLLESDGGQYYIIDYLNFDDIMVVYNVPYYQYSYYYY